MLQNKPNLIFLKNFAWTPPIALIVSNGWECTQPIPLAWRKFQKFIYFKWLKMHLNYPPLLKKNLKFSRLKWLKVHLSYPPWLKYNLKFSRLKWLKMYINYPPWLKRNLKFCRLKWLKMYLHYPPWLKKIFTMSTSNNTYFLGKL